MKMKRITGLSLATALVMAVLIAVPTADAKKKKTKKKRKVAICHTAGHVNDNFAWLTACTDGVVIRVDRNSLCSGHGICG